MKNIYEMIMETEDKDERTLLLNGFQLKRDLKKVPFRNGSFTFAKGYVFIPLLEARSIVKSVRKEERRNTINELLMPIIKKIGVRKFLLMYGEFEDIALKSVNELMENGDISKKAFSKEFKEETRK